MIFYRRKIMKHAMDEIKNHLHYDRVNEYKTVWSFIERDVMGLLVRYHKLPVYKAVKYWHKAKDKVLKDGLQ